MTWLQRLDEEKARSIALFVSDAACVGAVRAFIANEPRANFHLVILEDGVQSGLVDSLTMANRPANARRASMATRIDSSILASVARLVWFIDESGPIPPSPRSGRHWCRLNVALGLRYGLTLECYDAGGNRIASPFDGEDSARLDAELRQWHSDGKALAARFKHNGLVLSPYPLEPMIWTVPGYGVDSCSLAISPNLTWRIRRLELWMDDHETPNHEGSDQDWAPGEEEAFAAELHGCAQALREELGVEFAVRGW